MSIVDIKTKAEVQASITSKKELNNFKSVPTIVSKDLVVEGEVVSLGLIEIEGKIKGKLKGNSVVLREDGFIEGTLIAESATIRGRFEGNIHAQNIVISAKAVVFGNIEYCSLIVEDGASIDAQFKKIS